MTQVCFRMDEKLKARAESLFEELGMSMSTAWTIFVKQALLANGLPFAVTTARADSLERRLADARAGMRMTPHELIEVGDE
jgi:addiction module RelB/DinJ family antitoxin